MKKVFKNIFASALPQIMNIITNMVLPSYIILKFGSEINGLISSTKAIISYISIVGAGIATATTQALYEPVANHNTEKIKGMLNATNRMFNKYGLLFCAIAIIVAFIYPLFLTTNVEYYIIVSLMIVMSISGMSEFFAIGRCRSLLYANQKTYVCTIIQGISIMLSLILAIVLLKLNVNVVLVQLAISSVYVFRAFFLISYVKRNYPELSDYKNSKPIYSATEKRKDAMIHQLSGLAVTNSQPTILTLIVGLNAASIYSVYNIIFSGIQSICANLNTAITPFIGREYALKNKKRIINMYDIIEFSFFYMSAFIYSVCMLLIVPFVKLYTSKADINYTYPVFAIIFVFSSAFYILKMPSNSLINISGQFKETRWRAIFEGILTITLGILLTKTIGLNGIVLGTGITLFWRCLDTIIYTNKNVLSCTNKKSIFRLFRVLLFLIVSGIISLNMSFTINNYFEWIIYAIIISMISLFILLLFALLFDFNTFKKIIMVLLKKTSIKNVL